LDPQTFYSLPNIVKTIKPKMLIREEHVARKKEIRNAYEILVGRPQDRGHMENIGVHGRIKYYSASWI